MNSSTPQESSLKSSTFKQEQDQSSLTTMDKNEQLGTVQSEYKQVNKEEWSKAPEVLNASIIIKDDKQDELLYASKDINEVITLPTLHLKDKPVIIEREVQYEKPIEIKQTIIHQEKPIIVEQPIIKEKYEHYKEDTTFIKKDQKIIRETELNNDSNLEQEALLNLRQERINAYNNTTPIIQHKKEHVQLPTVVNEQPTIINEKEVLYQQPVEIEQKFIEKVKPIVNENVTLQKEHVHEKLAPEIVSNNATTINQGHEFYSKDGTTTTATSVTVISGGDIRNNEGASYVAGQEQLPSR